MDNIIKDAFLAACSDPEFHDQWMTSDTWAELICLHFNLLEYNSFTGIQLNKVFQSRANAYTSTAMDIDRQNVPLDHFRIFRDRCYLPKRTTCYYSLERGQAPKTTPGVKWFREINDSIDLKVKFKTRKEKCVLFINGTTLSENSNKRKIEEVEKALLEPITTVSTTTSTCIEATNVPASDLSMYWESKEAQAIFQPNESKSSALEAINNQIEVLKQAVSTHLLMPSIIDGDFEDITKYKAVSIREKCHILSLALSVATDNLLCWKNWNMCCEVVIGLAKRMGLCAT
jgi:hypothetical protein